MRLTTKIVIGLLITISITLMMRTNLVSNLWSSATGRGFFIPVESSLFTFMPTKMNYGSGEWWLYAEDDNYYYSMEKAGIDKPYILISKSRVNGIPEFDKHDYKTWRINKP